MEQFDSGEHIITLAIIAGAALALCVAARSRPGPWTTWAARGLALVLVTNELSWQVAELLAGTWRPSFDLPLNLCDLACFLAAAALWTRRSRLAEVTWFWALGGSLQALLTPDTGAWHFPSYGFLQYYVGHGAIVAAALFLVVGLGLAPQAGAIRRTVVATVLAALVAAVADLATGGDYMFLVSRPQGGSLLDLFGPWPLYLVGAAVIALLSFTVLDLPFQVSRWFARPR